MTQIRVAGLTAQIFKYKHGEKAQSVSCILGNQKPSIFYSSITSYLASCCRVVAAERRGSLREDKGGFLLLFQSPLLESPPQAPRRGQFSCSSPTPSGLTTLRSSALGMDTNIHPNTHGGLAVSPVELEETSLYSVFPLAYNNKLGKCRNNG